MVGLLEIDGALDRVGGWVGLGLNVRLGVGRGERSTYELVWRHEELSKEREKSLIMKFSINTLTPLVGDGVGGRVRG